jgi:NADPH:quinone reductase-like Zn-dependent oxidoreductase
MPRAVRFDHYGDRDVLYLADVPVPVPSQGEVLVRVHAAGINPGEIAIRTGRLDSSFPATFPSGEGSDLAGIVTAVGSEATAFSVGDEVLGWSWNRSSHADYVVVPSTQLIAKPPSLSWEVAGSLYVVGCTAYAAVRAVGVRQADTVAVSAAAGGVGTLVVQLLRRRGATAIGIASQVHHGWLEDHGVVPVAYGDGLEGRLRTAAPNGVDAFIDLFGPEYVELAIALGVRPDRIETIISRDKALEVGAKTEGSGDASTTDVLSEMAELVASGQIELPIAATYPLEKVREAFAELEHRHTLGKIVLIP